tara:strand:+ start:1075 stop:1389 length:315 start_codon:yes stop_codon:yes gene_type:complete
MEHIWKVYDLDRTISNGVVIDVTYACESSHDNFSTRIIGDFTMVGSPSESGFIPYEDLTEEEVLVWVSNNVNESAIETSNSASIALAISSSLAVTTENGVPWNN